MGNCFNKGGNKSNSGKSRDAKYVINNQALD